MAAADTLRITHDLDGGKTGAMALTEGARYLLQGPEH